MSPFLIVCNWKTYLPYNQIKSWLATNASDLQALSLEAQKQQITLVLAPPTEALSEVKKALHASCIQLAAQNCSAWGTGAHTGETTAESIAQIGCTYSLIGHSERRIEAKETEETISKKYTQAITAGIMPILCVGESLTERQTNMTEKILENQLNILALGQKQIIVAYEPVWAIGTGVPAEPALIIDAITHIKARIKKDDPDKDIRILYGGSVTAEKIKSIVSTSVDGLLIGKASIDFQELKKIVFSLLRR